MNARSDTGRRWLAWTLLWSAVFWFGITQAWEFSDIPPRPPLLDVLGPIGLWTAMIYFFAPVLKLGLPPVGLIIAALAWSALIALLIVLVENGVTPRGRRRISWSVLAGVVGSTVVLRILGAWPASWDFAFFTSAILWSVLVPCTWLFIVIGGVLAMWDRGWRRSKRRS